MAINSIINTIVSRENFWDRGMTLGIVLAISSIFARSEINFKIWEFSFNYSNSFDYLLILFLGVTIFFFFMAIRLNTEVNESSNIQDMPNGTRNNNKTTHYETFLTRFNVLSKASFIISVVFALLFGIQLLVLVLT